MVAKQALAVFGVRTALPVSTFWGSNHTFANGVLRERRASPSVSFHDAVVRGGPAPSFDVKERKGEYIDG